MALINLPDPNTTEGKQSIVANQIRAQVTQSFTGLKRVSDAIAALVFSNSLGLTPQQVCDAIGSDAGSLVGLSQAVGAILNGQKPGTVNLDPPAGLTVTVNQDGTVTIGVV